MGTQLAAVASAEGYGGLERNRIRSVNRRNDFAADSFGTRSR